MAAFSTYSTTASANTAIGTYTIAENATPPSNVNNALAQLAAEGRELYDLVNAIDVSSYMAKSGGAFTGQITRSGSGGYLYNVSSAQSGGAVHTVPSGSSRPSSPQEGTFVFYYS